MKKTCILYTNKGACPLVKKTVLLMILIFSGWASNANDCVDWKEYAGSYAFSGDGLLETFDIAIQGDTLLTVSSALGEAALTYVEKDRFEFPQYGGIIIFERNEAKKIAGCRVSIALIEMEEIKAKKQ